MENLNKKDYIRQLLFQAYGLPIQFFDDKNFLVSNYVGPTNPFYLTKKEFLSTIIDESDPFNEPLFKVTKFLEYFIVIRIAKDDNQPQSSLVIGPMLMSDISEEMVAGLLEDLLLPNKLMQSLVHYYKKLTIVTQNEIEHVTQLAYFLIYKKKLPFYTLFSHPSIPLISDTTIDQQMLSRRLDSSFHMDQRQEQMIWQYIKEGNKEKLILHLNQLKVVGVGLLSKTSHVRHTKNNAIVSITLATRAAIEGGLYPEIAYTLSDIYIQQVEDSQDANQINLIVQKYFFLLIERLNVTKSSNQSKHVSICKNFIFNHIFENISIRQLAELVHLNPTYLSQTFKKETGVTLGKYILNEKLAEAKRMLVQSDISIAEISMLLHFSDQSYFTSVFKKSTGLTPRQYRNNQHPLNKKN